MSRGRYVKPAGRTYAPNALLSLVVRPRPLPAREQSRAVPLAFGEAHAALTLNRRGKWSEPLERAFLDATEVIPWIEGVVPERVRTLCVSPVASTSLTLCGFWPLTTIRGARWSRATGANAPAAPAPAAADPMAFTRLVARGRPDIISYSYHDRSFCWVSGCQYLPSSEAELAESVRYGWAPDLLPPLPSGQPDRSVRDRCHLWLTLFRKLADWWREVDGGPWGLTVGQLAEHFFRARIVPKSIVIHNDKYARQLEAAALWGGRASVWYYGDIGPRGRNLVTPCPAPPPSSYPGEPGPMHHVDVRSMYPFLLASRRFPTKLLGVKLGYRPADVLDLSQTHGVVASVLLGARHGEYPHRYKERVTYPIGEFTTVLCGPELAQACRSGECLAVHSAAVYEMGQPFKVMAEELLALRSVARDRQDGAWELFVKLLSNSFAGKLAQRIGRWTEAPKVPPEVEWGEWLTLDTVTGLTHRYRSVAGLVWEHLPADDKGRTLGSCFAYLTSYGRWMMRQVRETCPAGSVYSQDTDGLWVSPEAVTAIKASPLAWGDSPGDLRLTGTEDAGRFFSPKHYWTPSGWVLSGLHCPERTSDGLTFRDSYAVAPLSGAPVAPPRVCLGFTREVELTTMAPDGKVEPNGWVSPPWTGR